MHDAYAMSHTTYCYMLKNVHEILAERSCRELQRATVSSECRDRYVYVYACICMHMYNIPSYIAPWYNTVLCTMIRYTVPTCSLQYMHHNMHHVMMWHMTRVTHNMQPWAVLHCAVPCYTTMCYAALHHAVSHCTTLCHYALLYWPYQGTCPDSGAYSITPGASSGKQGKSMTSVREQHSAQNEGTDMCMYICMYMHIYACTYITIYITVLHRTYVLYCTVHSVHIL